MSLHALLRPSSPSGAARQRAPLATLLGPLLVVWAAMSPGPVRAQPSASAAASVPACAYGDVVTDGAGYDRWATTIVDTELRLPDGYAPPDLVSVGRAGLAGSSRVRALVVDDLREMAAAARAAGAELSVISAYRSEASQRTVFADWERQVGRDAALLASARPGHSEHELGTTIDFTTPDGRGPWSGDFSVTTQGRWLLAHAAAYGFVPSYPAASSPKLTCYQAEPWHFRYVGRSEARDVESSGQPLRAFLFARLTRGAAATDPSPTGPSTGTPSIGGIPATDTPSAASADRAPAREAVAQVLPAVGIGVVIGIVVGRLGTLIRAGSARLRARRQPTSRAARSRR